MLTPKLHIAPLAPSGAETERSRLVIDTSNSREVLSAGRAPGFAFLKTLQHLGLDYHRVEDLPGFTDNPSGSPLEWRGALHVEGTTRSIKENIGGLHRHIGLIARCGTAKESSPYLRGMLSEELGRSMGVLATQTLLVMDENTPFTKSVKTILNPFAEYCGDESPQITVGAKPYWRYTETERQEYFLARGGKVAGIKQ